ncbi:MAG TPA: GntG family PLP-dependent aldolase [Chloroflexota bacterium]|jgi:threonine aldolase|nr:GntG family PLP-dependent aldolase [Chloroflexota bacterium]
MIELRSDTFTLPTPEMMAAAASAPLGDDVWGEDPTAIALEEKAARIMGKEAAVFLSSGSQGNLAAILSHTKRGDEVIVGERSHIFNAEAAGAAMVGGVQLRTVPNTRRGTVDGNALRRAVRPVDIHYPPTTLICVENTQNQCGGAVLAPADMAEIRSVADDAGARVHLDGARIFNASIALGIPPATLAETADSVTFCLSKGLSAPVGSLLCGSAQFVERARKYRKMLGGGMRQVGVIAAPGIVALDTMVERLADDHANARKIGIALNQVSGVDVDLDILRTNIVVVDFEGSGRHAVGVVDALARHGVLAAPVGKHRIRLVTHRGVSSEDVALAIEILCRELAGEEVAAAR